MLKKIKNRIQAVIKLKNVQRFNADKWLTENFEKLVNKYPGEYIIWLTEEYTAMVPLIS